MNAPTSRLMTFAAALLFSLPVAHLTHVGLAEAGPGGILRESRDESRSRGHKMERRERRGRRSSNDERRSSRDERRTTRTTRSSRPRRTDARPVGPPRVVNSAPRGRRTTRATRSRSRTHHQHVHTHTTTHVHHTSQTHHYTNEPAPPRAAPQTNPLDGYLTLGLGAGGFDAPRILNSALPGSEFNLGLGVRGDLLGFELGFHGGGYKFDRHAAELDIAVMGLSGDLKLQPKLGILEPYVMAGLGGYLFQDAHLQESAVGGAVRLGGGLDLRFNSFGVGLRYLYNIYGFGNDLSFADGLRARSESIGLNATFFF
ncbi:hypothetical protein DL240_10110 [Lujinxingia litoralis]|uniref:Outer membrane protein beta-barrel domain-containing protein n=1 Tax=Lujinxingia litoralis TaxID=2211119 RepID=A0A328C733_9DELT|nr:hypothetical protein [Lujinxingia litoralis]RAL22200.1 hypothetical protein DL240_10110 [Lujinxingia litoralis]